MINYRILENLDKYNIFIIKIFFELKIICYILIGLIEVSFLVGYYGKGSNLNFVVIICYVIVIVKIVIINCYGGGKY